MSVAPKFSKLKKSKNWWKEGEREEKAMKGQPSASSRGPVKFRMPTAQNLVPIRLDLDIDRQRFKDCFTWNPSGPDSEIVVFARRTAKDLKLPPGFVTVIASAIQSQIVEFRSLEGQDMYSGERIVLIKLDLRMNRTVIRDQFLWESKLKAARMHIFVRRGGPNYRTGLAKMSALGEELGVPLEVYGPEATMTEICKQAIECIVDEA